VFGTPSETVALTNALSQTALEALKFLSKIDSPRAEEFRVACDAKFELSTVFKPPAEQAILRKHAIVHPITDNDADVTVLS
jgi:N-alpha-acetyltransferase 15/16, NatA auxiliary subunit